MSLRTDWNALRQRMQTRLHNWIFPEEVRTGPPPEDIGFMPDTLAALFQRPPTSHYLILRGALLLVIIALLWSAFATLEEITVGEGKVIPTSQIQVIQNMEGGIVSRIPVQIGDIVRKGDVVLNIDETRFSSSLGETQAKYHALRARIARLTAESDGSPYDPDPADVKENPAAFEDERIVYSTRAAELDANLSILRQQAGQRSQELNEKRARYSQLQESYKLVAQELKMSQPLAQQGVMSEVEILRLERQVNDIRGEMEATRLSIPRLEASIAEANSKLDGALAKFRSDAAGELSEAKAEFASISASSTAAEDRLRRTTVRSPVNGIIKQIKVNTVGGVVQPGMDVMEIVPLEDNLLIEARIRPADVGFLRPGLKATVKISAYDFSIYGGLDATVENITADSITAEDKKDESFYLVRVRTKRSYLGTQENPLPIIPGMLASVHIQTGKKTVLTYLLKPIVKAKNEAMRER